MIEKSVLPQDASSFRGVSLPIANDFVHALIDRESGERVKMVGHREKKVRPEFVGSNVVLEGSDDDGKSREVSERVGFSLSATEGDEEYLARFYPRRSGVKQTLTYRERLHGEIETAR